MRGRNDDNRRPNVGTEVVRDVIDVVSVAQVGAEMVSELQRVHHRVAVVVHGRDAVGATPVTRV